jgi:hypothetical protein
VEYICLLLYALRRNTKFVPRSSSVGLLIILQGKSNFGPKQKGILDKKQSVGSVSESQ